MGQVGQKAATVVVGLDSVDIIAGTTIFGRAYLVVHKDIDDCTSVVVSVMGNEVANIVPLIGKKKFEYKSMLNFYANSFPLCEVDGKLLKGSYEFPFQCTIPADVPTSMNCSNAEGDKCAIQYYVDVRVHRKGWLCWDLQDSIDFTVVSPPLLYAPGPATLPPVAVPVKSFGMIKQGVMFGGAIISANTILRDSVFEVTHIVQNKSSASVQKIRISFFEHIQWQAENRRRSKGGSLRRKVKRLIFTREINASELTAEDKQSILPRKNDKYKIMDEDIIYQELQQLIQSKRQHGASKFATRIPDSIWATYPSGKFVRVWHQLEIEMMTGFASSNPIVTNELFVRRYVINSL
jgi:hypothetical protein